MEKLVYFTAIFFVVIFLPIPVMLNEMRRETGAYIAVLKSILAVGIATMIIFMIAKAAGEPVGQTMYKAGSTAIENLLGDSALSQSLGISQLSAIEQKSFLSALYTQSSQVIPAFILILASIISYFEYKILARITRVDGKPVKRLPKFREFSMPGSAIFGWCLIFALAYIASHTSLASDGVLLANVESLFLFFFSMQGLSTILMFFYTKRIPTILTVLVVIFVLGNTVGEIVMFLLGLFDLTFHFKDRLLLNNKR